MNDEQIIDDREQLESVKRLTRDLALAGATLSDRQVRFMVDAYYILQEARKRSDNQLDQMQKEPHDLIDWLSTQSYNLERQIVRPLVVYTDKHPAGQWLKANYGIGPVISAGLLAHIDIKLCPTVGHIWRFAGLDPTTKWVKATKRPWNASLKTLCWKTGQSFMKFSNKPDCTYGHAYKARKEYEIARNERGENAETAARTLREKTFKNKEIRDIYASGKLPPGQIDARARRWATKLFLSHLHLVWYFIEFKELPPKPYVIEHLGHVHFIKPQHLALVPGLEEALSQQK